jgi:hypothetical protein
MAVLKVNSAVSQVMLDEITAEVDARKAAFVDIS